MASIDARKSVRQRKLLGAKIQFNNKNSTFDCTVKNLSEGGAHLQIESIVGVPRNFTLYVPNLDEKFQCQVAWNTMTSLGVSFRTNRTNAGGSHLRLVQ